MLVFTADSVLSRVVREVVLSFACKTASRRVVLCHISLRNAIAAVTYCETSSIINGSIIGEVKMEMIGRHVFLRNLS